jgi:hypothetical protein
VTPSLIFDIISVVLLLAVPSISLFLVLLLY